MTTMPALERALDQAAHRYYGRRRRSPRWLAAPALALACGLVLIVLSLIPTRAAEPAQAPAATVPERTLALSQALTAAPREPAQLLGHSELAGVAAAIATAIPYPPGMPDTLDWTAQPADPTDMASINHRNEVQALLEYRAGCLWLAFWDGAWRSGNEPALAAATTVLDDLTRWPSMRGQPVWPELAAAAAARHAQPLQAELDGNCKL